MECVDVHSAFALRRKPSCQHIIKGRLEKQGDERIEKISGGYIHEYESGKWEIIDDRTGEVISVDWRYDQDFQDYCVGNGISTQIISDDELEQVRQSWRITNIIRGIGE